METKGKDILGSTNNIQRSRARRSLTGAQNVMKLSYYWRLELKKDTKQKKGKQGSDHKKPSIPCQEECVFSKKQNLAFH